MTMIHTAIAMFLTQNDNSPSQAIGPVNASAVKAAGVSAAATRRLKCATHGLKTGWSWRSQEIAKASSRLWAIM
jgi:hypothetical protein